MTLFQTLIQKIPHASNELIFILGCLGLLLLLCKRRNNFFQKFFFFVLIFAVTWRSMYAINSSRYFSGVIFAFIFFSSCFLFYLFRKTRDSYLILFPLLLTVFTFVYLFCKNFSSHENNKALLAIVDLHKAYNRRGNSWTLLMPYKDSPRISFIEKNANQIEPIYKDVTTQDISIFFSEYRDAGKKVLYSSFLSHKEKDISNSHDKYSLSKHKHIFSFKPSKKKKYNVYKLEARANVLHVSDLSNPTTPGLLENGDLERLDNPETSFNKLKSNIQSYSQYYKYDESIRTPINAFFHTSPSSAQFHPYFNALNSHAIFGKNSARISTNKGYAYILFFQKFYEGEYAFSVYIEGKKNTTVSVVYDSFFNGKWTIMPLASYTFKRDELVQIRTSFAIDDLKKGDYFLVGSYVDNGEAYFDNFSLTKQSD